MNYIGTTRFNEETWNSNKKWRENNNFNGCIYGSPNLIKNDIPIDSIIFVIEMNNDKNMIMGIGLIKNKIVKNKKYKIYNWGNYNRFIYKGKYRIDRNILTKNELKIIQILEILIFKGSKHLKRGQGIIFMPDWIINNKTINFNNLIKKMFINRYELPSYI